MTIPLFSSSDYIRTALFQLRLWVYFLDVTATTYLRSKFHDSRKR